MFLNERYVCLVLKTEVNVFFDYSEALWSDHEVYVRLWQPTGKNLMFSR